MDFLSYHGDAYRGLLWILVALVLYGLFGFVAFYLIVREKVFESHSNWIIFLAVFFVITLCLAYVFSARALYLQELGRVQDLSAPINRAKELFAIACALLTLSLTLLSEMFNNYSTENNEGATKVEAATSVKAENVPPGAGTDGADKSVSANLDSTEPAKKQGEAAAKDTRTAIKSIINVVRAALLCWLAFEFFY